MHFIALRGKDKTGLISFTSVAHWTWRSDSSPSVCEERAGPAGPFSDTGQDPEQDPELDCGYRDLAHVDPAFLG